MGAEKLRIEPTALDGVVLLTPARFEDDRGWFMESYSRAALVAAGIATEFVQDNHSFSRRAGTLRGLHYQAPPRAQAKLVRVVRGAIRDVAVDARGGSPTFGRWISAELSAADARQIYIPAGFLHGFVTLEPDTEVIYKCSAPYDPALEGAVRWDSCGIDWGLGNTAPILSRKDAEAAPFDSFRTPFVWERMT